MSSITFNPKFLKEKTPSGKYVYQFQTLSTEISIGGALITQDTPKETLYGTVWSMPQECQSIEQTTSILSLWHEQCSSSFTKPPPLNVCIQNAISQIDPASKTPIITTEEESKDWIITWSPTRIQIDTPKFILYWGPVGKKENTRINEELVFEVESTTDNTPVNCTTDTPIVGLEELNLNSITPVHTKNSMEKDTNKVVSAYEKARQAYEKATYYNEKFYKKYGFYAVNEDGSETSSFQSEAWTDCDDAE